MNIRAFFSLFLFVFLFIGCSDSSNFKNQVIDDDNISDDIPISKSEPQHDIDVENPPVPED